MTDVRAARPGDAAALARLATQLGYPADEDAIAQRLAATAADDVGISLVALAADGGVCGFARALPQHFVVEAPFVELAALVVADAVRGQGVGAALLARVEAWAREQGFAEVRVRSNVIRGRAHRFYRREGYVEDKRQVVFSKPMG
ncbi:MAG: GNAT family N-acetyltransferase [Rhodanobacteraceae bacterium]